MANLPCFDSAHLEATCKVLGDTTHGLTGTEIRHILCETNVADLFPQLTKWKRLYNALAEKQNQVHAGNFVIQRSEEHTSELQSLMRISYAVFCLKKKKYKHIKHTEDKYKYTKQ